MRAANLVRNSVSYIAWRGEGSDQMVHDLARSLAESFQLFWGVVEIRLGDRQQLGCGDDQNDFAFGIGGAVQCRQVADAAALELLELLRQLSRHNWGALTGARLDERVQ